MPSKRQPFDSGLPRVAEFEPRAPAEAEAPKTPRSRERALSARVKLLWDSYQDLKTAWAAFVRGKRKTREKAPTPSLPPPLTPPRAGGETPPAGEEGLGLRLLDPNSPLSQEFHATAKFQKLHSQLRELWADEKVRAAWTEEMGKNAEQWAEVNGNWEAYQELAQEINALESRLDELRKEQFDERGKSARARRRTLKDDVVDTELALEETRGRERALHEANPALAARILAAEFVARRKELHSKDSFMWFASRRAIREQLEKLIAEKDTLRLIVLEGEAGTGKTTLAKMLARHFTGQDPLSVEVGEKTKVDRALFADETLDPAHPTVYRPVLYALTGKRRPGDSPEHQGRAVFADELNALSNDEARILTTALDRMRVGEPTGYHLFGADPEDRAQPKALVIGGQNPAGGRFRGRTEFTPEVKRKLALLQLEYFTQTPEDPELYEAFQVSLMDPDGRIAAKKDELGPGWSEPTLSPDAKFKQAQLKAGPLDGGALWRLAQMLHESYENLYKRKNVLTDANPDAHLQGRVLPPGDIFQWLRQYQTEVKRGTALQDFLALKLHTWLQSAFKSAGDQEDQRLYSELGAQFGFLEKKDIGTGPPLYLPLVKGEKEGVKITPDLLTDREIAELSPRVPRPKIALEGTVEAGELTRVVFDYTTAQGTFFRAVEARILPFDVRGKRLAKKGAPEPVYRVVGYIKECSRFPDLVNQLLLEQEARPDQKFVVSSLEDFEEMRTPLEFEYNETEARRLGLEKLEIRGVPEAQRLIEQIINKAIDITTDAGKTQFVRAWQSTCPDLPMPCVLKKTDGMIVAALADADLAQSNFWYLTQLQSGKIITNLEGAPQPAKPHFDEEKIILVDKWPETDYNAPNAAQKHRSPLLQELLGQQSTVNIKRQDLDAALWVGDPVKRVPSAKHIALLRKLGADPSLVELRLIRQDEYARLANDKAWGQKNLWTNFDHFFLEVGGDRFGLGGGRRDTGGPSHVGLGWRGLALDDLAVRLVLARK